MYGKGDSGKLGETLKVYTGRMERGDKEQAGNTEIILNVSQILGNDCGVTYGIPTILIYPWIQTRKIHVFYWLVFFYFVIELSRIGATSEETVSRVLSIHYI